MNPKMRRNFTGEFAAQDLGKNVWRLTQAAPHNIDVIVRDAHGGGARPSAARAFGLQSITNLGVEWHGDMALLSFLSGDRVETIEGANVMVHEPLQHLYASLPLAKFDRKAQIFWNRVFRLVRIPGGRYLLRFVAR